MSTVRVTEQAIMEALRCLPFERWPQVLAFIDSLQPTSAARGPGASARGWTTRELRALPPAERDAILTEQATALADEYRSNPALTGFEAFGDEDLYVDSSAAEAR
jgi:hypothetical protein